MNISNFRRGKEKDFSVWLGGGERVSLPKRLSFLRFSLGMAVNTAMTVTTVEHYFGVRISSLYEKNRNFCGGVLCVAAYFTSFSIYTLAKKINIQEITV